MEPVGQVALLALLYKTAYRDRHEGPEALCEDIEGFPQGLSLAAMVVSSAFQGATGIS